MLSSASTSFKRDARSSGSFDFHTFFIESTYSSRTSCSDDVSNGEIAVVLVNGYDATLKKFTKQGELIILEPQSDDENFKTQVYDKTTPIRVIGKYVGKMEINK